MMGAHQYQDDTPKMCFNAAKSWFTNWYSKVTINTNTPWSGKLVGIDDYLNGQSSEPAHYVVANVGNLYLMYNRQEGCNSQVVGYGDNVTVIEQASATAQSWVLKALSGPSEVFRSPNWASTGKDLVIQVCERVNGTPDYAKVLVYLEETGNNNPSCATTQFNDPPPSPTPSPTPFPPTPPPTPKPTPLPTPPPTPIPTTTTTTTTTQPPPPTTTTTTSSTISTTTTTTTAPPPTPNPPPPPTPQVAFSCSELSTLGGGACKKYVDANCNWVRGTCVDAPP
jgi:hypothetical protein